MKRSVNGVENGTTIAGQESKRLKSMQIHSERQKRLSSLFVSNEQRFVLFPIKNQAIWEFYKKQQRLMWTAEEINLQADAVQFSKLNADTQHYIKYVLGFFASSDGIVNENLVVNLLRQIDLPEARCFYMMQMAIENVHAEMYSLMIDVLIPDAEERTFLFNAINTIPCVKKKADWALRYMNDVEKDLATTLVAFAAVEGIFFSASFCAIYWLKRRGLMIGLGDANELIRKDEGIHADFACLLAKDMIYHDENDRLEGLPQIHIDKVRAIIREAVEYEKEFVVDSLPVKLIGMNSELMCQYVEFIADRLLQAMGCEKLWNTPNPFEWMVLTGLQVKTNIHERVSTEYSKSLVDTHVRLDGEMD